MNRDRSLGGAAKARDQLQERRLSGSRRADEPRPAGREISVDPKVEFGERKPDGPEGDAHRSRLRLERNASPTHTAKNAITAATPTSRAASASRPSCTSL